MKLVRLTIVTAAALLAVAIPASGEDVLRFETSDWVLTAPATLGSQADLELNGLQTQLCSSQIRVLVGRRPRNVEKFTMQWVVDGNPAGSYATPTGVVNHVPDTSWRLVFPESRTVRQQIVDSAICFGPHEVTHVLTWESFRLAWANEGFATFTDRIYDGPSWSCCREPAPIQQTCDETGYGLPGGERHEYSDLSQFEIDFRYYSTAACFWIEVHELGGFPAIRGMLAGMRARPPETTAGLVALASRVLNRDLRPLVARYGFEPSDLKAAPVVLAGCTLIGSAQGERIVGTDGPDTICGLAGNDPLTGGAGADILDGGPGADTLNARDGRRDVVRGGPGRDSARVDRLDRVIGVERLLP
jgi:RTX calcium-binding nonapeptide repeat (4 copies)